MDKDGYITIDEVKTAVANIYKKMGDFENPGEERLVAFMNRADGNKDGKISKKELQEYFNTVFRTVDRTNS